MARVRIQCRNMRERVRDRLRDEITSGRLATGDRMAPIKILAHQSGASFRTVQMALLDLQQEGLVELRHGAGTFVTDTRAPLSLNHAVALCMNTRGHLMHDFSRRLTTRLHDLGQMPMAVDAAHDNAGDIIRRLARSGTGIFVVHSRQGRSFPAGDPVFRDKLIIGVMDWDEAETLERVVAVLVDHRRGGELVARYLHQAGHRRVLLVGPESMLRRPDRHAAGFIDAWRAWGGRYDTLEIHYDADERPSFDRAAATTLLSGRGAPTAVFGMRDFDICSLAAGLADGPVALARQCELVGYGNTPWSSGGLEGFSSVDWDLGAIVEKVCGMVAGAADGRAPAAGTCEWVAPRLVLRGTRVRATKGA